MSNVISINDSNFDQEVSSVEFALVDFTATWCKFCPASLLMLEKLATDIIQDRFSKAFKVDTDESPEITSKLGIKGLPTLVFFKNGRPLEKKSGISSYDDLGKFWLSCMLKYGAVK